METLLARDEMDGVLNIFDGLKGRNALDLHAAAPEDREADAVYALASRACEKTLACEQVLAIYRHYHRASPGPGRNAFLAVVTFRTLYKARRYGAALELVQPALEAAAFRNDALVNMAMNVYGKNRRWEDALILFKDMAGRYGLRPDAMSYGMAVNAYGKAGRWRDALALLDEMLANVDISASSGGGGGSSSDLLTSDIIGNSHSDNADSEGRKSSSGGSSSGGSSSGGIASNPAVTAAFNAALDACEKAGQWVAAVALFRRAPEIGVVPDAISYGTAASALARGGECDAAADLFVEMTAASSRLTPPGATQCAHLLTRLAKHGAGAAAVRVLDAMRDAKLRTSDVSYNAALTALYRAGDLESLLRVHGDMRLRGLTPDRIGTSQAFHACATLRRWDAAADVLRDGIRAGFVLDEDQTARAFGALARAGRVEAVRALLGEMETRGLPPQEGCCTALVTALLKQGASPQEALAELRKMDALGLPLGAAAFTSVVAHCKRAKEWRLALDLFAEMEAAPPDAGRAPNQITYNALLGVLTYSGRLDLAAAALGRMAAAGFEFDEYTLTSMLLGFAREGRWQDVLDMEGGLEALQNKRPPAPRARQLRWACYNEALRGCAALGDWEAALRILSRLKAEPNMEPDIVMYGAAITACAKEGRWREALGLIREQETTGGAVAPNVVCYSSAMTACEKGAEWRKALHLLLRMINLGLKPDLIAYNAAISASAHCAEWHMALKLFDSLLKAGLQPDAVTYGKAMVACFRGGRVNKAMELFVSMQRAGVVPSKQTINVLIELLHIAKQYDHAAYVYESAVINAGAGRPLSGSGSGCYGVAGSGGSGSGDGGLAGSGASEFDPSAGVVVDLHGYSATVARAAIRIGLKRLLQRYINSGKDPSTVRDFTIITGVGAHSEDPFAPVLRPALQNMLLEEVEPALPTSFTPGNKGRLVVSREHLLEYLQAHTAAPARGRAPADARTSLKLRSPADLRAGFEQAVEAAAAAAATAAAAAAAASADVTVTAGEGLDVAEEAEI